MAFQGSGGCVPVALTLAVPVRAVLNHAIGKGVGMRRFTFLGLALLSVFAFAAMTAVSASASLPDVSLLPEEKFPVDLHGTLVSKDVLETAVLGEKLTGTLVVLLLLLAELSALGNFIAVFTGVKEKTLPCKTAGAATETVETKGEWHLVLLVGGTKYGIVFLPSSVVIACGEPEKTKIHVRGAAVAEVTKLELGKDQTKLGGILEGSKGKNNITEYLNSSGTATKGILESNFGAGFEQSDESVEGEIVLEVLNKQMIKVEAG
jgi:hypothetical protein